MLWSPKMGGGGGGGRFCRFGQCPWLDLFKLLPYASPLCPKRKRKKEKKKIVTIDTWHVTCDMWHATCDTRPLTGDTWHVTHDMWHVTFCGGLTFSQNVSSLALKVFDLWYLEDLEKKADWPNELINCKGVCKTARATPGLLKLCIKDFI